MKYIYLKIGNYSVGLCIYCTDRKNQRSRIYRFKFSEVSFKRRKKARKRKLGEDGLPELPYAIYNIGNNQPENLLDFVDTLQQELKSA